MAPQDLVVGRLADRQQAARLVAQLRAKGIPLLLHPDSEGYILRATCPEDLPVALEHYRIALGLPGRPPADPQWEAISSAPPGRVTLTLIALCCLCWPLFQFDLAPRLLAALAISESASGPLFGEMLGGQLWRLFTPIFLHFHILHLLFNMLWLYSLGNLQENLLLGRNLFIAFVMVVAALSNVSQYLLTGPAFGGMSAVVFAQLGLLWSAKKLNPRLPFSLPRRDAIIIAIWFLLCLSGLFPFKVANLAHAVGLGTGILFAVILAARNRQVSPLALLAHSASAAGIVGLTLTVELLR